MLRFIPKKRLLQGLLIWIYLLGATNVVGAQAGRSVVLSPPDLTSYPQVTLYFDVFERDSSRVSEISKDQITLMENEVEQDIINFNALKPGIQLVTAFNISAPFAIQDIRGKSRFDYIQEILLNWAEQTYTSQDDLSLLSNQGLEVTHLSDRANFVQALGDYHPDIQGTEPNFNVLSRAIEIAGDPVDQLGMKRVVLLFTPPVSPEGIPAIESLISQAEENQVMVYIILVSSPAFFESSGAQILKSLTEQTSGIFATYSGEEPLPDFEIMFAPLRNTYLVQYQSQIVTAGEHLLEITISTPLGDSVGQREFHLDVQPPNPIFSSPPRLIQRELVQSEEESPDQAIYQPNSTNLDIIIEFPDGNPRDLEEVIFRVDGEIIDRKTTPPFDQFIWDLTSYKTSAVHYLTLEAVDTLGLSRLSVKTPVEIRINHPPPSTTAILKDNAPAIAGLLLLITLGFILFVLITRGTIKPAIYFGGNRFFHKKGNIESELQIRKLADIEKDQSGKKIRIQFGFRLIPVSDVAQQLITEPIQVWENKVNFGNNPDGEIINIQHTSVVKKHTQITIKSGGDILIKDEGSTTGTWINYKQILTSKPQPVKDGDIIHIGEAGFRLQVLERVNESPMIKEKI